MYTTKYKIKDCVCVCVCTFVCERELDRDWERDVQRGEIERIVNMKRELEIPYEHFCKIF